MTIAQQDGDEDTQRGGRRRAAVCAEPLMLRRPAATDVAQVGRTAPAPPAIARGATGLGLLTRWQETQYGDWKMLGVLCLATENQTQS